jgi:hypothetical protein
MTMHVVDFREFYASKLGQNTAQLLNRQLAGLARGKSGETVMGLGYAMPYLETVDEDVVSLSFMLARQGVIYWPVGAANRAALVDECDLPRCCKRFGACWHRRAA